jgi:hypothetical protein
MKRTLTVLFALIGWFAVIAQYVIMVQNKTASLTETTIRFISFFTILTNALIVIYFTVLLLPENKRPKIIAKPGTLTAITIYILMVGLVYQVVLRSTWQPKGLQLLVDELLHSVMPVLVIIYWYLYENKRPVKYSQIPTWAIYPLAYLVLILLRGSFSKFYPYPFVDVTQIGLQKALINSAGLLLIFFAFAALFIFIGKAVTKK